MGGGGGPPEGAGGGGGPEGELIASATVLMMNLAVSASLNSLFLTPAAVLKN